MKGTRHYYSIRDFAEHILETANTIKEAKKLAEVVALEQKTTVTIYKETLTDYTPIYMVEFPYYLRDCKLTSRDLCKYAIYYYESREAYNNGNL